jgi:hypothetical protein
LIVVGLRLCGHRHFRLENVRLPPVSLAAEICSVLRSAYPAGKASEAIRRIRNEKRPSLPESSRPKVGDLLIVIMKFAKQRDPGRRRCR